MPQTLMFGFFSLRYRPTPQIVPPVPTPQTRCVTRAVRLFPDFRPRLLVVGFRVRQVVVLIRLPRVRRVALEARRHRVVRARILGIDVRRADDDFGAEGLERVDFLFRLLVGRREDALVAFDDRRDRQAHPQQYVTELRNLKKKTKTKQRKAKQKQRVDVLPTRRRPGLGFRHARRSRRRHDHRNAHGVAVAGCVAVTAGVHGLQVVVFMLSCRCGPRSMGRHYSRAAAIAIKPSPTSSPVSDGMISTPTNPGPRTMSRYSSFAYA